MGVKTVCQYDQKKRKQTAWYSIRKITFNAILSIDTANGIHQNYLHGATKPGENLEIMSTHRCTAERHRRNKTTQ